MAGDGSTGAPGGTPQVPHLLDGYAVRPTWEVAGVDYAVGVHPGITLKVPTANNLPAGAALGNHVIYINGTDVTLSGYNLSGYTVLVSETAKGTATIIDCAATDIVIRSVVDAQANVVVKYCSLDGGGTQSDPNFNMIKMWVPQLTVEYCEIKNGAAGIQAGGIVTVKYNVLSGFAWFPGEHANAIAIQGSNNPNNYADVEFNTLYGADSRNAEGFPVGIGTGIAFYNDAGGNFYNSTVANNTVIANLPGSGSYLTGFYVDPPGTATGMVVRDNFYASVNGYNGGGSGAYGALYISNRGNVQATYTGNIDMNTGKLVAGSAAGTGGEGTSVDVPVIAGFSDDTGVSATDHITNDNTVKLTGTAVAGSTIKVLDGSNPVGSATVDASGHWTVTTSALVDGAHKFTATATSSGVTSAASTVFSVTVDTAVPNSPVISSSTAAGTGSYLLKGTAEAGSTVNILDGTNQVGTIKVDASGAWSHTVSSLSVGTHSLTAKAVDVAGNASGASAAVSVTVSGSAPTGPTAPAIDAKILNDSGVSATDHITNDNTVTLTGTAVAGSTIKVLDGSNQVGSATVDASGHWTVTTSALVDGAHKFTATATSSGVTSAASTVFSVTVDTAVPNSPVISSSTAAGTGSYLLKGTADAGSTVNILDGTNQVGTIEVDASGAWSHTVSSLSVGTHSLTAKAVDVAGNASGASAAVSVTVSGSAPTGPTAPAIDAKILNDSGVSATDHITNDNTVTLTGTAVAGSTIKVLDGSNQVGSATVDASGHWTVTTSALVDGSHSLKATATTSTSDTSPAPTLFEDFQPWSGAVSPDGIWRIAGTWTGTGGNTLQPGNVKFTDTYPGETNTGFMSLTVPAGSPLRGAELQSLPEPGYSYGYYEVRMKTADVKNGGVASFFWIEQPNYGSHEWDVEFTLNDSWVGTTNPGRVSFSVEPSGKNAFVNLAFNPSQEFHEYGFLWTPGRIDFTVDDQVVRTVTDPTLVTDATGYIMMNTWSGSWFGGGPPSQDATSVYDWVKFYSNATSVPLEGDRTGVGGTTTSAPLSVTVDTKAPTAPMLKANSVVDTNHVQLSGTTEAGSAITVYDGSNLVGSGIAGADGSWSIITSGLSNGTHTLTAAATDVAGNASAASQSVTSVIGGSAPTSNLVINGGFETGDFTGWTVGEYQPEQILITSNAHSGNFATALGPAGSDGSLSENLATVAGQHYTLHFSLANMSSGLNDFSVHWDGTSVFALVDAPSQSYTDYTFDVIATDNNTRLEFDFRQDPTQWRLDDVSVVAIGTSQPPPATDTSGNDVLRGTTGGDLLAGGTGDDTYTVNSTGDKIIELANSGTDNVETTISYTLPSNVERLQLTGGSAINGAGNDLNNIINGNDSSNLLEGNAGNDTLNGQGGEDTLLGGSGNDVFQFSSQFSADGDQVLDFVHDVDKLDFSKIDASAYRRGDQSFTFDGYTDGGRGGHLWAVEDQSAGVTHVYGQTGGFQFHIDLQGTHLGLTASDFIL